MNGKGLKRRLPSVSTAVPCVSALYDHESGQRRRPPCRTRSSDQRPIQYRVESLTKERTSLSEKTTSLTEERAGNPYSCACRRRRTISTLRLAGILGVHVLGFMVCPCQGFAVAPVAGVGFVPDRRKSDRGARHHHSCNASADSGSCGSRGGSATFGGPAPREREKRPPPRYGAKTGGRRDRSGDGSGITTCHATRISSAEDGRPSGLLYDGALLKAGVTMAEAASPLLNGDNFPSSVPNGAAIRAETETVERIDEKSGTPGTADGGRFVEMTPSPSMSSADDTIGQNLTAQWAEVVNGAMTANATVTLPQQQQQQQQRQPEQASSHREQQTAEAAGNGFEWSRAGWLGVGVGWEARCRWECPRVAAFVAARTRTREAGIPSRTGFGIGSATGSNEVFGSIGVDGRYGANNGTAQAGADASGVMAQGEEADQRSVQRVVALDALPTVEQRQDWRVWRGPEGEREIEEAKEEKSVSVTAREELTLYLLETGATHYDVSTASAALSAMEPELGLTEVTWKRWRQNLEGLKATGFTGTDVANMLALCPQLLALDYEGQVVPTTDLLRKRLGMRPTDVRRVIRKAPEVLAPRADGTTAADAVDVREKGKGFAMVLDVVVLRALGLQMRHLKMETLRWPQLLAVPPSNYFQLAAFLASDEVGIKATNIGSLVRQAPWLVLQRIDGQMLPVVRFLRRAGVVDVERVVRAYPRILCANIRGELAPRVRFLWVDVGVSEEDLPRVLQTFPLLFAVPMARMKDVVDFLSDDLTISGRDIAKIIRAFPSLLGLERDLHMAGVVAYLKKLGVQNVGRFVSRLPPVLGYDVKTNLTPKMDYLVETMGLSVYDILTFPAYFSYPLQNVIEPRTEFLNIRGRPITLVGLNIALQQGDADFARKVAKVQPRVYREFKEAYMANREAVRNGEMDAESILSESQRQAIGNLGGQSTSNNVSEVTAKATGLPPERPEKGP